MPENEQKTKVKEVLKKYRKDKSALIDILHDTQAEIGYLPKEALEQISAGLEIPLSRVFCVVTFFKAFSLTQRGRHLINVCMGTACHLAGGQLVLEATARELDLEIGGITADLEFSLERVACIGCCALAPVVTIGEQAYPRMTPTKIEEVLVTIKPAASEKEAGTGSRP